MAGSRLSEGRGTGARLFGMMIPDYYRILEVHPDASPEVIEKAFKALSMKFHPDRQPPEKQEWATQKMKQINEAHYVLSDSRRRHDYLRFRRKAGLSVFWEEGLVGLARRFWNSP